MTYVEGLIDLALSSLNFFIRLPGNCQRVSLWAPDFHRLRVNGNLILQCDADIGSGNHEVCRSYAA